MPITCAQCSRAFAWKQPRHEQLWLRETNSTALWPDLCLCRSASKHLLRVPQKRKAATKTFPSNLDPQTWNVWKRIINGKISLWEDTRSLISELAFRIVKKRLNSFADRWHLTCVVHANLYSRKRTWDALIEKSFLQEQFPRKCVFNSTKPNNPDITHQDNPETLNKNMYWLPFSGLDFGGLHQTSLASRGIKLVQWSSQESPLTVWPIVKKQFEATTCSGYLHIHK